MEYLNHLKSKADTICTIGFDFASAYKSLLANDELDFLILATQNGLPPMGSALYVVSEALQMPSSALLELVEWNQFQNNDVSNICLRNKNPKSKLKGIVLAACENSKGYSRKYNTPNQNFYFDVAYEAIHYAAMSCGARKIGLAHLSSNKKYHSDIAACSAEAVAHFHGEHPDKINAFAYVGSSIQAWQFGGIEQLNQANNNDSPKIQTTMKALDYAEIVTFF